MVSISSGAEAPPSGISGISEDAPKQDLIVIGASLGGVEVLRRLIRALPSNLRAAALVVLHSSPDMPGLLPQILAWEGTLPARHARDGETITPGNIYIAPPDQHLIVEDSKMRLVRGPKENYARPAIDPLFRTAAQEFGSRVVGVILSGALYDGTSGLWHIKRRGGVAIVQAPEEAAAPSMPESAIANVAVDYILPLDQIAPTLVRLAREGPFSSQVSARQISSPHSAEDEPAFPALPDTPRRFTNMSPPPAENTPLSPDASVFEHLPAVVAQDREEQIQGLHNGRVALFTCPECSGTLWQADAGSLVQFRCHVGHAFTGEALAAGQGEAAENALWFAIRTLIDRALLLRQLAEKARAYGNEVSAQRFEQDAQTADEHAEALKRLVNVQGKMSSSSALKRHPQG